MATGKSTLKPPSISPPPNYGPFGKIEPNSTKYFTACMLGVSLSPRLPPLEPTWHQRHQLPQFVALPKLTTNLPQI